MKHGEFLITNDLAKAPSRAGQTISLGVVVFCALMVSLVYYGRFYDNFFCYDDFQYLANNLKNFSDMLLGTGSLRIIPNLIWVPFYAIFGMKSAAYNLMSILLHAMNAGLMYLTVEKMFKNQKLAVLSALFFVSSVSYADILFWKSASSGLIAFGFIMLSIRSYLSFRETGQKSSYWYSLGFFVLAMLSKEDSLSLFIILILIEMFFLTGLNEPLKIVKRAAPFGIIVLLYFSASFSIMRLLANDLPSTVKILTVKPLYSIFGGLSILIVRPHGSLEMSAVSVIILLLFAGTLLSKNGRRLFLFCVMSIIAVFFPSSLSSIVNFENLSYPVSSISRYLYFPAFFLSLAAAFTIARLNMLKFGPACVGILLIGYFVVNADNVWSRGREWKVNQDYMKSLLDSMSKNVSHFPEKTWLYLINVPPGKHTEWAIQAWYRNPAIFLLRSLEMTDNRDYREAAAVYIVQFRPDRPLAISKLK